MFQVASNSRPAPFFGIARPGLGIAVAPSHLVSAATAYV